MPDYLHGLLEHWEFLLFLAGVVLLALEIFVVPGFGVTGISGMVCIFAGLVLSMLQNKGFNFDYVSADAIVNALVVLVVGFVGSGIGIVLGVNTLIKSRAFKKITVSESVDEKAFDTHVELVGQEAVVFSVLRLSGKIEFEGKLYDAQSVHGQIEKGQSVKIISSEGITLKVRKISNED